MTGKTDPIRAASKFFMPVKGAATQCYRPGDLLEGAGLDFALKHGFAKRPEYPAAAPTVAPAPAEPAVSEGDGETLEARPRRNRG